MLLVLQIAGGIVLGWFIIQHWDKLLGWARNSFLYVMVLLGWAAFIGALYFGGSWVWEWTATNQQAVVKYAMIGTMMLFAIAACVGSWTLVKTLWPKLASEPRDENSSFDPATTVGGIIGLFHIVVMASLVNELLPIIDTWSRSNGYKDLGGILAGTVAAQWQWFAVWAVHHWRNKQDSVAPAE